MTVGGAPVFEVDALIMEAPHSCGAHGDLAERVERCTPVFVHQLFILFCLIFQVTFLSPMLTQGLG
jgi:hypothetical protein